MGLLHVLEISILLLLTFSNTHSLPLDNGEELTTAATTVITDVTSTDDTKSTSLASSGSTETVEATTTEDPILAGSLVVKRQAEGEKESKRAVEDKPAEKIRSVDTSEDKEKREVAAGTLEGKVERRRRYESDEDDLSDDSDETTRRRREMATGAQNGKVERRRRYESDEDDWKEVAVGAQTGNFHKRELPVGAQDVNDERKRRDESDEDDWKEVAVGAQTGNFHKRELPVGAQDVNDERKRRDESGEDDLSDDSDEKIRRKKEVPTGTQDVDDEESDETTRRRREIATGAQDGQEERTRRQADDNSAYDDYDDGARVRRSAEDDLALSGKVGRKKRQDPETDTWFEKRSTDVKKRGVPVGSQLGQRRRRDVPVSNGMEKRFAGQEIHYTKSVPHKTGCYLSRTGKSEEAGQTATTAAAAEKEKTKHKQKSEHWFR